MTDLAEMLREWGPAVADHLWQSTAFAGVAALLALLLRRNHARTRHGLWVAASVKFLVPFALLMSVGSHIPWHSHAVPQAYVAIDTMSQPFTDDIQVAPMVVTVAHPAVSRPMMTWIPAALGVVWLVGTLAMMIFWLVQWRRVRRAVRRAQPMLEGREVECLRRMQARFKVHGSRFQGAIQLRLSAEQMEPGVVGIARPVLLWPEGISQHLDEAHLESILAHEVCHVRRRDNLTSAIPMVVEAVFWFHPLVWWMARQLVKERERACDEEVLRVCARPQAYAEGILKVCEYCVEAPLQCVSGITGADLKRRVVQIMTGGASRRLTLAKKLVLAAVALCAVAMPVLLGQAQAARKMMLAAAGSAPKPVRAMALAAAHAMIPEIETPYEGLIAEAQAGGAAQMAAQDSSDRAPLRFDVVSVRPSAPEQSAANTGRRRRAPMLFTDDGLSIQGASLHFLVMTAYEVNLLQGQILNAPNWVDTQSWSVEARVADSDLPAFKQIAHENTPEGNHRRALMLQALLAERFKLKAHLEMREGPVYTLEVAKGGVKAKQVSPDNPDNAPDASGQVPLRGMARFVFGPGHLDLPDSPVGALTIAFTSQLGVPVIDKTGLTGRYDLKLDWQPDAGASAAPDGSDSAKPSLYTAMEEQLGLKLVPGKGPLPVVVIDQVDKPSVDGAELAAPQGSVATDSVAQGSLQQFDAATIKHHNPNDTSRYANAQGFRGSPGGRIFYGGPARMLIEYAYGLQDYQVTGGPEWAASERFEVNAVPPDNSPSRKIAVRNADPTAEQRQMLQTLLRDRFGLQCHIETKEGEVYILSRGTKPLELTPTKFQDADPRAIVFGMLGGIGQLPNGGGTAGGSTHSGPITFPDGTPMAVQGYNTTTDYLAIRMSRYLQLPVLNQTGIEGSYDFDIPAADAQNQDMDVVVLSLVDRLGLKIKRGRGAIQTLVIDHIERPSEN